MMRAALLIVLLCLGACATTDNVDPYEKFNRSMYAVNRFGDKILYKPFGKAYKAVIPSFARKGVNNFFDNLTTPRSALNNFLQGKPSRGFNELIRFTFNSTLGLAGLFDVAASGGMGRYDEDFSQTLSVWGSSGRTIPGYSYMGPADDIEYSVHSSRFHHRLAAIH